MNKIIPSSRVHVPYLFKSSIGAIGAGVIAAAAFSAGSPDAFAVVEVTSNLTLTPNATLNLGSGTPLSTSQNSVIVTSATAAAQLQNIDNIRSWIITGYAGGLWTGKGITSVTAANDAQTNGVLGVMEYDNDQLGYTNWDGKDLTTTAHQVMLRVTYAGDYDGDGTITPADYGFLDFYFSQGLNAQGDIDGDGMATPSDYGLLDFTFSQSAGTYGPLGNSFTPPPAPLGVVPEPGSIALSLCASGWLLSLRRRKC